MRRGWPPPSHAWRASPQGFGLAASGPRLSARQIRGRTVTKARLEVPAELRDLTEAKRIGDSLDAAGGVQHLARAQQTLLAQPERWSAIQARLEDPLQLPSGDAQVPGDASGVVVMSSSQ